MAQLTLVDLTLVQLRGQVMKFSMNIKRPTHHACFPCLLGLILLVSPAAGQVFDLGPSDSALFDSVINVPADPDFDGEAGVGGDGLTTQLNISDGFVFGDFFGPPFDAFSGSEVNVSGGLVFGPFVANSGSEVNVSGGSVGDGVVQTGGFNGQSGSVLNLSGGNVFGPIGISGEMNMSGGTVTGDFFFANPGSMVNISGGTVSAGFFLSDASEVNISGGTVLHSLDPSSGSVLNINGCLLYTSPSPRDGLLSRMPSSA